MGHYGAFPGAWKRGGIREAARGRGMGLLIGSAERPMSGNAEGEVPSAGNLREDGRERGYGLADLLEDGLYRAGGHVHDRAAAIMSLSVMSRPLPLTMQVCSPPTPREGVRS